MAHRRLADKYKGQVARVYDQGRDVSDRRKRELEIHRDLAARFHPTSLLDLPCGTGRLFEPYLDAGVRRLVAGDVSDDMLEQARARTEGRDVQATFVLGSIFDPAVADQVRAAGPVDVAMCMRFVNWLSFGDVERVLATLVALESPHFVLGASIRPDAWPGTRRLQARAQVLKRSWRRVVRREPHATVHDEGRLLALTRELGLTEVERHHVFTDAARENCILVFRR